MPYIVVLLASLLALSCTKTISEKQQALEKEVVEEIAEARQEAEEEKQSVEADTQEELVALEKEKEAIQTEKAKALSEIDKKTREEIKAIKKEALEQSQTLYLSALDERTKNLEKRLEKFGQASKGLKEPSPVQAEWIAKVNGATLRVAKLRDMVKKSQSSKWKDYRKPIKEAYSDLYVTLSQAEKAFGENPPG